MSSTVVCACAQLYRRIPTMLLALLVAAALLLLLVSIASYALCRRAAAHHRCDVVQHGAQAFELAPTDDAVLKNGFATRKVAALGEGELDTIVIGSGIGGLLTAALLAKRGQKVLVLEQHDQVCVHSRPLLSSPLSVLLSLCSPLLFSLALTALLSPLATGRRLHPHF